MTLSDEQALQEIEYTFPYHHLPFVDDAGVPHHGRRMTWAFEYLAYTHAVERAIASIKPSSLLDVGCGDGRLIANLKKSGFDGTIVGCDRSSRAIAFARAFTPYVDFIAADVSDVDGTFDLVTCIETLEHVPEEFVEEFVRGMVSRMSRGGRLLVCVPSVNLRMSAKHYRHYTLASLRGQVEGCQPALGFEWGRHLCRPVGLVRWYERLLQRSAFRLEIPVSRRAAYRHYLALAEQALEADGLHVLGCWQVR